MTDDTRNLIVAGSRSIENEWRVESAILKNYPDDRAPDRWDCRIVHGGASGADAHAAAFAEKVGLHERVFEAAWSEYGNAAGPIRNQEMAEYGDLLIAVWDGESPGTRNMIEAALDEGLPVHVEVIE